MLIQITYKRCIAQAVWYNTLCNNVIFSRRGARLKVHTFYLLKSMCKSHSRKRGFIRAIWTGSSNMEFVGVFTQLPETHFANKKAGKNGFSNQCSRLPLFCQIFSIDFSSTFMRLTFRNFSNTLLSQSQSIIN